MQSFLFNKEDLGPVMEGFPELQSAITSVSVWMGECHWIYYISNYSRSSKVRVSATTRIRQVTPGYLPLALSDQFDMLSLCSVPFSPVPCGLYTQYTHSL